MAKYKIKDLFEGKYQIGSGFTTDFDYEGMLNAGLNVAVDTDLETLRKMSDDFEDVNYHRENNHLQKAIEAIEGGDMFEAEGKLNDFFAEIRKTMETFDMDASDGLGDFMASKIEENNEIEMYDVVDKASGEMIDDDLPKRMALALAAKKKGWVTKKSQKKKMNEIRIDRDVADKIEGMLSRPLKAQFLDAFDDLWEDLTEDDMFYPEDVINHLHNEMHKRLRLYRTPDFKQEEFTAIPEGDAVNFDMKADTDYDEGLEDIEESLPKKPSIIRALKVDGNGTKMEIDSYMASLKRSGDEFDDVDDYVEDFKNYIDDKALQEHFKRFM